MLKLHLLKAKPANAEFAKATFTKAAFAKPTIAKALTIAVLGGFGLPDHKYHEVLTISQPLAEETVVTYSY